MIHLKLFKENEEDSDEMLELIEDCFLEFIDRSKYDIKFGQGHYFGLTTSTKVYNVGIPIDKYKKSNNFDGLGERDDIEVLIKHNEEVSILLKKIKFCIDRLIAMSDCNIIFNYQSGDKIHWGRSKNKDWASIDIIFK